MQYSKPVSICIVTYNNADKIRNTIKSITKYTGLPYTLYISDNGSTDDTVKIILEENPNAVIIENNENLGFGKANNKVLELLDSKYHVIINPDITFNYDVISELCDYLDSNTHVAMAAPKILSTDGSEQHLPKRIPTIRYLAARRLHLSKAVADEYSMADQAITSPTEIGFCSSCFFVIRTEVFKSIEGFDERFFMYMEDADLTIRTKHKGKVVFLPDSYVTHLWEKSSAKSAKYFFIHLSSIIKFFWKYKGKYGAFK